MFLCLYESFWKRFESDQRRLTLLVIKMRLLVWRVVNKTLKFRLTFLILLTINFPLTATRRQKEIADKGCRPSGRVSSRISTRETGQVTSGVTDSLRSMAVLSSRPQERRSREKNKNRLPGFVAFSTAAPFNSF